MQERLFRLECSHPDVEFNEIFQLPGVVAWRWGKDCSRCGKVLEIYHSFEEMKQARAEYYCAELRE